MRFEEWCKCTAEDINGRVLHLLCVPDKNFVLACELVASDVPDHYTSPEYVVRILDSLGKQSAAEYLRNKLPQTPKIRSGDLGEILATQYIDECTVYITPIKRLRWKDHREVAMRGDDVIGIALQNGAPKISFLKSEAKSRAALSKNVVKEARRALNANDGLPSPHALAFIADRLRETNSEELADLITIALLKDGISSEQVQHLLFIVCGNAPDNLLRTELKEYDGSIQQIAVGLRITKHQEFIATVYKIVETGNES